MRLRYADSMSTGEMPVRPVNDTQSPPTEHKLPRSTVAIALVAIGGLLGWLAASLGGGEGASPVTPEPTTDTIVPRATRPPATVNWVQATAVPAAPLGMEYAGTSAVAELNGRMHMIVNFHDPSEDRRLSQLWRSDDGLVWDSVLLEVGDDSVAYELTTVANTLLMTGQAGSDFALWQSVPGRSVGGSSWNRVELDVPDNLEHSFVTTAANTRNEIVTVVVGDLEIWPEVIEPHLPENIDLDDPAISYQGDQFLYLMDGREDIRLFAQPPELVVAGDNIWVRLILANGDELLQTVDLPPGTYPVSLQPTLAPVEVAMAWFSTDANDFLPVIGRNALPLGYFIPEPWGDRFIAAAYEPIDFVTTNEPAEFWLSGSGRAWQPATQQPPPECAPFYFAISGSRIHVTSDDGVQCVRDIGTPWEILDEPSQNSYVVGGLAGFLGYPDSFESDPAFFSRDGIVWAEIEMPAVESYPSFSVLDDRLLAIAANRPGANQPTQLDIWVGEID